MSKPKKSHHSPTRHQPLRATRATSKPAEDIMKDDITVARSSKNGVQKSVGKPRAAAQRKRKKAVQALVKKVDARDPHDAFAEQAQLLQLSALQSPVTPTHTSPKGSKSKRKEKKYMDDTVSVKNERHDDHLQRGDRWIPDFEHRPRLTRQPNGVPYSLWMAYKHLDDYIYRHSLSAAEIEALPLLEDVHAYQDSDGRGPKPLTPPGYQYDEHLELVPVGE
ncbi:hypothetical protein F4777DRAFT_497097 [Nemania sp. FL0916]|nr:hypothetical protein F4777DRAFT_497097 [Nemania sp. FL0916]